MMKRLSNDAYIQTVENLIGEGFDVTIRHEIYQGETTDFLLIETGNRWNDPVNEGYTDAFVPNDDIFTSTDEINKFRHRL